MTPDSEKHRQQLLDIADRFRHLVAPAFSFLTRQAFTLCASAVTDLDDLRDAMATCRFVRGHTAVDVSMSLLTRQIVVTVFTYAAPARCDDTQRFARAAELDSWLGDPSAPSPPRPSWMKKRTLEQEMRPSINAFVRKMDLHMDDVIAWLALSLAQSGLLREDGHPDG